jgi:hypothetical protein
LAKLEARYDVDKVALNLVVMTAADSFSDPHEVEKLRRPWEMEKERFRQRS